MKENIWLLVANSSTARLFKIEKGRSLVLMESFEHPESRLHNRDLVSDKPGRAFESMGQTRHSLEAHHSPKHQEYTVFARDLVRFLESARMKGEIGRLYIAANPVLLGLIRESMSPELSKLIESELDKDLTQIQSQEILSHFPAFQY